MAGVEVRRLRREEQQRPGEIARRASQRAFLRLVKRGQAYTAEAPTMWDVEFQSAVAQAEIWREASAMELWCGQRKVMRWEPLASSPEAIARNALKSVRPVS